MKTITIVFTRSKKRLPIGSWLIMLWTMRKFSHVAVCFDTTNYFGTKTYYQASDGLVNYMSEYNFIKKHKIVESFDITISDELYKVIRKECHSEAGANYGFLQNLGIVLADLLKLIGVRINNPWKEGRNCSELLYVNILSRLYKNLSYDPDLIKPHHVYRILTTSYRR